MDNILGIFLGGFIGGVAVRSVVPALGGEVSFVFSTFLLFVSLLLFIFSRFDQCRGFSFVIFVAVFVGSMGVGVARYDLARLHEGDVVLEAIVEQEVIVNGIVVDEPDVRSSHTLLTVDINLVQVVEVKYEVASKMLVRANHFPEYHYGDEVSFIGVLRKPKNFINDKNIGRDFDYVSYLGKSDIYYQMFYPQSELLTSGQGNLIKQGLFALKELFIANVRQVVPEPHASLLGGVVVGAKQALGEEILDDFRTTGIIHIVVLSGYNITIVADAIGRVFSFAPRLIGLVLSTMAIAGFALMTGLGATIVRASIMAFLALLARTIGRTAKITRMLFVAGFVMVLINPKILIFDTSFQLSFLATLGLIYFSPPLERLMYRVPEAFGLRSVAAATIATQIFVLPLLLYLMGEMSLVSLPVNLLILLFVPLTMLLGFLIGVVGLVSTAFSLPFAYVAYFLLAYDLKVVDLFASVPFASVTIPSFPFIFVIVVYSIYGYIIIKNKSIL